MPQTRPGEGAGEFRNPPALNSRGGPVPGRGAPAEVKGDRNWIGRGGRVFMTPPSSRVIKKCFWASGPLPVPRRARGMRNADAMTSGPPEDRHAGRWWR